MAAATTAFVIVVMVTTFMIVSTSLVIAFTAMVSATTCQMLDQVLYLFLSGITVLNHSSCEVQQLTCQRVVGIYGYTVFLDLHHLCHKLMILIVHQGDGGSLEDILVVEVAVDHEYLTIQLMLTFWHIFAKGFSRLQDEIEVCALLQITHFLLETIE